MCGIVGIISFDGHEPDEVGARIRKAADRLRHRGPDAEGFYTDGNVALGHRRLSIIDLNSGAQPMHTPDMTLHIVFNGEIYNFPELRDELEKKGHRFQTRSDTEVILLGYREWGKKVVERLIGMFAFAVWDSRERALFLARDRVGKKPLYFLAEGSRFYFASELKALLPLGGSPGRISSEALDCYFCFGYIPSPRTIYAHARKLEPAHTLIVKKVGLAKRRYWQINFTADQKMSPASALEEFESLLDEATRCRLMSEVPLGAFLSGGIDSGLVVSAMAKAMPRPVLTHSIGFGERRYNELPLAGKVAAHLKTEHREFKLEVDAADVLPRIAWHFDEPFADSSAVPTWHVCRMARQHVTVALSGDGGDESFGGYLFRYRPHMIESKIRASIPVGMRSVLFGSMGRLYPAHAGLPRYLRLKTILENLAVSDSEAFYRDLVLIRPDARDALYAPDFQDSLRGFAPFECIRPVYLGCNLEDPLSRSLFADIQFYMTEDVLVKVDRMSMAHSLEVRSPLLDHRVLEFAARLPEAFKIKGSQGKVLLRNAAERRLPPETWAQPKMGFSIPAPRWLRDGLKPLAEKAVFSRTNLAGQIFAPAVLARFWAEHQSGRRDHSDLIWAVLMLDQWEEHHGH